VVLDRSGPVEGVTVTSLGRQARTGPDGEFVMRFAFAPKGEVKLAVLTEELRWGFSFPAIADGETATSGQAVLGSFPLTVRVVDADGKPAPAMLALQGPSLNAHEVATGRDGEARFTRFIEGVFRVTARAENFLTLEETVRVPDEDSLLFRLPPMGRLDVRTVDAEGRAVSGYGVSVFTWKGDSEPPADFGKFTANAWTLSHTTDRDGRAVLEKVPAGTVYVSVARRGWHPKPKRIEPQRVRLEMGETATLNFTIDR
jgi:hypothetical protein